MGDMLEKIRQMSARPKFGSKQRAGTQRKIGLAVGEAPSKQGLVEQYGGGIEIPSIAFEDPSDDIKDN
jgi:hypothetical protein